MVFTTLAGQTLGTQPLSTTGSGANALTTSVIQTMVLPVGTDTVVATYVGDTNYGGAAPQAIETVNPATGNSNLFATPMSTTYGQPVMLTETVQPINNTCPAGPATFLDNGAVLTSNASVTLNAATNLCTATFTTNLLPVGPDTISATIPASNGFGVTAPTPIVVTIAQNPSTNDSLTTSPNPSNFGQTVTITETIPSAGAGTTPPGGMVTFSYNGQILGTANVSGGVAFITTATLPSGADPISALYTGDTNYAGVTDNATQNVSPTITTAQLTAGPDPATFGTPVTLTETITPINGVCPAGPATFLNNGTSIGTGPISLMGAECVATLITPNLPVGSNPITATVPASNGFTNITTGPIPVVINPSTAQDLLASSPNPSYFGNSVAITDTIPEVGGVVPTGTVIFYNYGVQIGTGPVPLVKGVATLNTTALPVGTDALTATYSGDGLDYGVAQSNQVNQIVAAQTTNPDLEVGPTPTNFGLPVTFTETIPVINGTPASGMVAFYQNGTFVANGTLTNGVATIMTSTLPVGTDQITAKYLGDANYAAVTSGPKPVVVNPSIAADVLTVQPNPQTFGGSVTLTDTIPVEAGVPPTGTVTFYNNGVAIGTGTPNSQGVATFTTTTLPVGTDPITATLAADTNYAQVTSNAVNAIITQVTTVPGLTALPNPQVFGQQVTLTETIPGINGVAPTGTVTFFYNGTQIGQPVMVTNGVAQTTTTTLPVGNDPLTATYSGDGNYLKATDGTNVTITTVPANDSLTAAPSSLPFGSPTVLTFTVPPVNGVTPTGPVSFYYGTTLLGTGTPSASGVVTLTGVSTLPLGTDTVTAKYPGDNTYAAASPTASVTVTPATPVSIVTVPASPVCGSAITLTDTITLINNVLLGGTVQFYDNGVAVGAPVPVPANGVVTLTTTALPCTAGTITAIYTPPAGSPYNPSTGGPTPINLAPVTPVSTLTVPTGPQVCGSAITLTDTITLVNGVPLGGTVQFYLGVPTTTPIGSPIPVPASGVVTLTTTSLPCTPDTIYAIYTPPANSPYNPSTGGPKTVNIAAQVLDFTISASSPQTINPGDMATYTVSLSGALGVAFNSPVTLSVTAGLPPGATVTFANGTYTPGVGPTNTTMTIVTAPNQASIKNTDKGGLNGVYYGLLLLPLLGVRRIRRKLRALPKGITYGLAALALLGGLGAMTGCGGGYFGPAPATYTITVTGVSGNLTHSTTVTLTVR